MISLVRKLFDRQYSSQPEFLGAMSKIAATVNVVTTDGPYGRAGMTVTAMSSVSADTTAPTLLVYLNRASSTSPAVLENGVFCVNVLKDSQAHVAQIFAGQSRSRDGDKFACTDRVVGKSGSPCMRDPLVAFDCRVTRTQLVGTHQVVFGEVLDVSITPDGNPLIYADRRFGQLANGTHSEITKKVSENSHAYDAAA